MKGTVFYKMTGSGNDFVMLDGRSVPLGSWTAERIMEVCDRRMGVGADGLVILTPSAPSRVRMDFFNCDGSRAAMCGNAALCSARLAAYLEMAPPDSMQLETGAGAFLARCSSASDRAELNLPGFEVPRRVGDVVAAPGERAILLGTVGVPHLVVQVADLEGVNLMERGRELRHSPAAGREGANVNFVAAKLGNGGGWSLRTFERGVEGETLACGTGAVAAAVALATLNEAKLPISIQTRSGRLLDIKATLRNGSASEVWLAGEGRMVFQGIL